MPTIDPARPLEGRCTCGDVRYRLTAAPMFVHCCHCRWCQRETGASFALNAMVEAERLTLLAGMAEAVITPSESGFGQRVHRCPRCRVALWSHYSGSGPNVAFVRVGTLDEPDRVRPDVHIFTASKQSWVQLGPDAPAFEEFYDLPTLWPAESLARREVLMPRILAWRASRDWDGAGA
jgi:hypothetical protein